MPETQEPEIRFTFDNAFVRELRADPETEIRPRQIHESCYSFVDPTKTAAPKLIAHSREMLAELDLDESLVDSPSFADVFTGNQLLDGMQPFAMCYGGHQFGNWAGQLGDGRAINLGEIINSKQQRWVLQLKGAGRTPYSRNADGLAVLRSSVREFLCSEAMYHLGVATTRALSLSLSGDQVLRDMLYDGNPAYEPGAIVCRVAPSFIRFGNFQIFSARGETEVLRELCNHTIRTDFPHLLSTDKTSDADIGVEIYVQWFQEVCDRTRSMVIDWMRVGFVHGVMNTDNMSILGLTIDYGPYGWLEDYDPDWTPNTTDAQYHRYAYGSQPEIACWNIAKFANAILPLVEDVERLQAIINQLVQEMNTSWKEMMFTKLGLFKLEPQEQQTQQQTQQQAADDALLKELMLVLQITETDYCIFFRSLGNIGRNTPIEQLQALVMPAYYTATDISSEKKQRIQAWLESYQKRISLQAESDQVRQQQMQSVNPLYVLRNYLAQQAIDKAVTGDYTMIHELLEVLRQPYQEQPGKEDFAAKRPDWARHKAGCSMLSCSS